MQKWGEFEFNAPYEGDVIEKINEVVLPKDYVEFMKKHNGGEGHIGETWLILYPLEELQEINDDYEIEEMHFSYHDAFGVLPSFSSGRSAEIQ